MQRRRDWFCLALSLIAVGFGARLLPGEWGWERSLSFFLVLVAALSTGLDRVFGMRRPEAFLSACGLSLCAAVISASAGAYWLACMGVWALVFVALRAINLGGATRWGRLSTRRTWLPGAVWSTLIVAVALALHPYAVSPRVARDGVVRETTRDEEPRPDVFLPTTIDDGGQVMALWSLQDSDGEDDQLGLWSLDLTTGKLCRMHRGYSMPLASWSPNGKKIVFQASNNPWDSGEPTPFGLLTSAHDGQATDLEAPPTDGTSWMYPEWSKKGNRISAWLLPQAPSFGAARTSGNRLQAAFDIVRAARAHSAGTQREVTSSYLIPAAGGPAQQVRIPSCQLSLFSAFEAEGEGGYVMTERGIYLYRPGEKPRRLAPAGEAPLDPFPMITASGVAPQGGDVAYMAVTFRHDSIDRIDLIVIDANGRKIGAINNIASTSYGWSNDGKTLSALQCTRRGETVVTTFNTDTRKARSVRTGLKTTEDNMILQQAISPDAHYVALNAGFTDDALLSVAVCDLQTGKTQLMPKFDNCLLAGWRADDKMILSDFTQVLAVGPDGDDEVICRASRSANRVSERVRAARGALLHGFMSSATPLLRNAELGD